MENVPSLSGSGSGEGGGGESAAPTFCRQIFQVMRLTVHIYAIWMHLKQRKMYEGLYMIFTSEYAMSLKKCILFHDKILLKNRISIYLHLH